MSSQKQSRLDLQEKQIKAIINALNNMSAELENLRNLSVGTLETMKLMPGYQKALADLTEFLTKNEEEE
jgi:hypothetical protein